MITTTLRNIKVIRPLLSSLSVNSSVKIVTFNKIDAKSTLLLFSHPVNILRHFSGRIIFDELKIIYLL